MNTDIRRMSKEDLDELNTHAAFWPRCKPPQQVVAGDTSVAEISEERHVSQLDLDLDL
jgi:hypothetical protein